MLKCELSLCKHMHMCRAAVRRGDAPAEVFVLQVEEATTTTMCVYEYQLVGTVIMNCSLVKMVL